ncbi:MAG: ferredoxin, partial [Gammaproteobacteria bacterium]|nr:ferredoxin [Gammaproteobacteria bacterium]
SLCVEICPVDCILPDPSHPETRGELFLKYRQLMEVSDTGSS